MKPPQPITLIGDAITLKPIALNEVGEYLKIGGDNEIWRYLSADHFKTRSDAERWIRSMLARQESSGSVTFSVYDKATSQLAGSTSLLEVRVPHKGLEIGYTWYGTAFQRSHVNTATKLVLLTHAFDELGAIRVQLQTDERNKRSQTAISRIGAKKEGILRSHKVYPDGYVRDSAMFSITSGDWPGVRQRLQKLLTEHRP